MAALVSLSHAKVHLRITGEEADPDVTLKIEQASDIVLDYLKGRANKETMTIDSSSIASPSVITVAAAHTFVDGETVVIAGHEDSVPDINGSHVISNVTTLTFTIPISVTTAGTGGTADVAWTETTVPNVVLAAVLFVLEDLYERRPINWTEIRSRLERSRDPAFA